MNKLPTNYLNPTYIYLSIILWLITIELGKLLFDPTTVVMPFGSHKPFLLSVNMWLKRAFESILNLWYKKPGRSLKRKISLTWMVSTVFSLEKNFLYKRKDISEHDSKINFTYLVKPIKNSCFDSSLATFIYSSKYDFNESDDKATLILLSPNLR